MTSVRIVNAHFHSGQNTVDTRNQDFKEIFNAFCCPKKSQPNQVAPLNIQNQSDDVLIFMGDLNYRINGV